MLELELGGGGYGGRWGELGGGGYGGRWGELGGGGRPTCFKIGNRASGLPAMY